MIHSLQIEKTMTKTVVVKRKAKRAGNGVNRCEYLRNEHHFPVAVPNAARIRREPELQSRY